MTCVENVYLVKSHHAQTSLHLNNQILNVNIKSNENISLHKVQYSSKYSGHISTHPMCGGCCV